MYIAKIENANGSILELTENEANYQIVSITGLNPPEAQINVTNIAGLDGARFNSAKLNTRNLVITLRLNNNPEENRHLLYRYFRTKEACTFYYKNSTVNVFIKGYVDTVECNLFAQGELMQISMICPSPYFSSIEKVITDISNEISAFHFPFSINLGEPIPFSIYEQNRTTNVYNGSQAETGTIIQIDIISAVQTIKIINIVTGEYIELHGTFIAGDRITINTNKGEKGVTLLRDAVVTNAFTTVQIGSTFFQLAVGDNLFNFQVDGGTSDDFVYIVFLFNYLYRGV